MFVIGVKQINAFIHVAFIRSVRAVYRPLLFSQMYFHKEPFCKWITEINLAGIFSRTNNNTTAVTGSIQYETCSKATNFKLTLW